MRQDFSQILEECLRLMQAGTPMEDCLKRFPEQADELRPRLAVAQQFSQAQPVRPPDGALQHGKDRLMAALTQQKDPRALQLAGASIWFPMPLRQAMAPLRRLSLPYRLAATTAAVFLMAGAVMGASAAGGDPGSPLRSWFLSGSSSDVSSSQSTPSPTPTPTATAVPAQEVDDEDDDVGNDDSIVMPTSPPEDVDDDADGDDDNDADNDGDDDDNAVTPTSAPDDDADEDDIDDGDDDDSAVTPTSTPDDDADEDDVEDDDDDNSTVTPISTPGDDDDAERDDVGDDD